MNFLEGLIGRDRRKNRIDFGGDPDHFVDPADHVPGFSALRDRAYGDRCYHLANAYELM